MDRTRGRRRILPRVLPHARTAERDEFRPEDPDELRAAIAEDLTTPDMGNLVAEIDGRIVGNLIVVPIEMSTR